MAALHATGCLNPTSQLQTPRECFSHVEAVSLGLNNSKLRQAACCLPDQYRSSRRRQVWASVAEHAAANTEEAAGSPVEVPTGELLEEAATSEAVPLGNGAGVAIPVGNGAGVSAVPEKVDYSGITEWELDFCSRPILDARNKRVWELLVCDSSRRLQHAEYFPSNKINSATLKEAIARIIDETGASKPQKIRFFRSQMLTIISKACAELDIQPVPSQRCITLMQWLKDRFDNVYKNEPGYNEGVAPMPLQPPPPQELPDSLRGERWAFVQLPLEAILEEIERVQSGEMFGSILPLEAMDLSSLPPDTMIPGVAVASYRATPLAAWTSALELATLQVDTPSASLVLSTGVADRWRYAFYRKSGAADAEAAAWEEAKRACNGLHFLAVQRDLEEEECTGFWLMQEIVLPGVQF